MTGPGRGGRSYSLSPIQPRPSTTAPDGLDTARGVFETLLVVDGRPIELPAHLARAASSVATLYGQEPPADAGAIVSEHAAGLTLGRLRIDFAPSGGDLAIGVVTADVQRKLILPDWDGAARLRPMTVSGGLGEHKWADRGLVAAAEQADTDAVPLIVDDGDEVLEASRGNVFAVRDGVVLTPPADGRILPGVARARAIEIARESGFEVVEQPLGLADLESSDEVFLTGSVRGIEPVRAIGDDSRQEPGAVTPALAARLGALWLGR
jgi:para-aminobenzoate synthetase/4-amino-4-deoxychorismate lyase